MTDRFVWAIVLLVPIVRVALGADEWPQFRGPTGVGHAESRDLPLKWSESSNIVWKSAIPGTGHSSPVISGNQIWLTTAVERSLSLDEERRRLAQIKNNRGLEIAGSMSLHAVCVERDSGKSVGNILLFRISDPQPVHSLNSYASPTPVIQQGRLYCHFGTYGTACVNTASRQIKWKNQDLKVDHQNGPGSSPILYNELLIVHLDGIDKQYVAALDTRDGKLVWKTSRSGEMHPKPEFQKAYCTPLVIEENGRTQLISPGANWVYSLDPTSGDELWRANYGKLGFSTTPRPVAGHGMVFVCTSYMESRLLAVRHDGSGVVTKTHIVWEMDSQVPKKSSTLLVGDELYLFSDQGIASCLDARTGRQIWRQRLGGQYSSSPIFADGRIYVCSQDGKTVVIQPGKRYHELAVNQLDGRFMASPAIVDGSLFLRTETHLYRIEKTVSSE